MRNQHSTRTACGVALVTLFLLGAVAPALGAGATKGTQETSEEAPVDLNTATVEGLTTIPGIGQVMAERIVQWREEHGPFRQVEDLMKVKGIGDKSFDKLRPYVTVKSSR